MRRGSRQVGEQIYPIRMEEDVYVALKREAKETGLTIKELFREMLFFFIRHKNLWKEEMNAYKD